MYISIFKYRVNIYDLIIILVIASLAYGQITLLWVFTPIRIVFLITLPLFIKKIPLLLKSYFRNWLFFIFLWWCYMALSIVWTPDKVFGVTYFIHMTSMFICILMLQLCSILSDNPKESVINGWILFCILTLPVAFWEIITGNHLESGSYNAGWTLGSDIRRFAAVTFQNLNSYVLLLSAALPFLVMGFISYVKKMKVIAGVVLALVVVVLLINASRVGFICLIVALGVYLLMKYRTFFIWQKVLLIFSLLCISYFVFINLSEIAMLDQMLARFEGGNSLFEDTSRVGLILAGLNIAIGKSFLGGGIMSMIPLYDALGETTRNYAHNLAIELIVEYGLVVCIMFFILLIFSIFKLFKTDNSNVKFLFYYAILTLIFLIVLDDYYQTRCSIWIYFASLLVFTNDRCRYVSDNKNE